MLAEYWGERWPQIRDALLAAGKDLSVPFEIQPWEECAQAIHDTSFAFHDEQRVAYRDHYYRWPNELTAEWLVENGYHSRAGELDAAELQAVSDLAASMNSDIEWRVDEFLFEFEAELEQKWQTGSFQKAPFSSASMPPTPEGTFHSSSASSGSWTARVSLTQSESADLYAKQQELIRRVNERTAAVRRLVKDCVED